VNTLLMPINMNLHTYKSYMYNVLYHKNKKKAIIITHFNLNYDIIIKNIKKLFLRREHDTRTN